ncbi:MAG: hypothetical protein MZV64_31615 [Ignavibacteriales bacterium]|nr:hypothetical protein [Ignavibacteriales bacterium]
MSGGTRSRRNVRYVLNRALHAEIDGWRSPRSAPARRRATLPAASLFPAMIRIADIHQPLQLALIVGTESES